MNPNIKKFLKMAVAELIQHDIVPVFSEDNSLIDNKTVCNGYFSDTEKRLVVATGKGSPDSWISYFAHEYCHFLQWKNKTKAFRREVITYKGKKYFALNVFWEWVGKKKEIKDKKFLDECFKRTRDVELECERMTVDLIKKYKLPVNLSAYIKEANAYVLTYSWVRKYRRQWKADFFRKSVANRMSKKFDYDYNNPPDFFFPLIENK